MKYQNNHVMKFHNPSPCNFKNKVGTLSKKKITSISQSHGFEQRSRKIKASSLLDSFFMMINQGGKSYWDWACILSGTIGKSVSKQAIFKRMTPEWTATVKALLQEVLSQQVRQQIPKTLFSPFKNIWLQDSTTIHLPDILRCVFKGNFSRGELRSLAKINIVVNVFSGWCPKLECMSYTVNEQRISPSILDIAKTGDLVIRDLGYFVFDTFIQLQKRGIYFLSKLRSGVNLYDINTKEKIDLLKLLNGKKWIDKEVLCTEDKKLKVRLVAIKLSSEQTNTRIRKAKTNRDRRLNHDEKYYKLLGYVIFITNVNCQTWDYKEIAAAYRVRWNIEIIFKSWKSGFHLQDIIPEARTDIHRVESILYIMLIYITWFRMLIYIPLKLDGKYKEKHLSIIKMVKFIAGRLNRFIEKELDLRTKRQIVYHCCYDKRTDRLNSIEALDKFKPCLS